MNTNASIKFQVKILKDIFQYYEIEIRTKIRALKVHKPYQQVHDHISSTH
jgi:hypothetical protein